jgi:hypothetical protein
MVKDDAGHRVSDLEPANAAPETSNAARKWFGGSWADILLVLFGIYRLGYVGYFSYGYWLGTPATATVGHCELGGLLQGWAEDSARYCDGTWSVDGQSQNGPIRPAFWSHDGYKASGSSLDVHVSEGTAYRWFGTYFYIGIIVGPILIIWGAANFWRKRRGP